MTGITRKLALAAGVVLLCGSVSLGISYTGSLTSIGGTAGGLDGTGVWFNDGSTIEWTVSTPDVYPDPEFGVWTYSYTLTVPRGGISHFSIEVSDVFTGDDIIELSGPGVLEGPTDLTETMGNPNMPWPFWGIKWDDVPDDLLTATYTLKTYKDPVWGDFYSKDGVAGGDGVNTIWNVGLTENDTDPLDFPSDGSVDFHLLVPDTNGSGGYIIPEPLTVVGVLLGLGGAIRYLRRRL